MANAQIFFHRCIQDSQDYGSNDEHMVSRVFFTLNYDGVVYENLYVDIKQPVGTDFETAPLEVGVPQGYRGPFNHDAFREEVEKYFRGLVGSKGSGIRISGGSNIRMRNNQFVFPNMVEIEIQSSKGGW
jgi:hypothetical protein